jgi:hypothetical protein
MEQSHVLTLNPSLFTYTLPLWAFPAGNAAELMAPRYDISPSTFCDVAQPSHSQTSAIFQRAGVQLHDRIGQGLDNEPVVGFHERLRDNRQDLALFRKRGKRGGVKHRQIQVPDGTSG